MKKINPNRRKHHSFVEFILNDDTIVVPLLMNISMWFGAIIFSMLTYISFIYHIPFLAVIFGIFAILGWRKIYMTYKVGGIKSMKLSTSNIVWDKDYIKISEVKKDGRKTKEKR